MGKKTAMNRKKKLERLRKKQTAKLDIESLSFTQLLANAQEHIDSFQYEKAQELCQEALKQEPDNVLALETSASLCLEVGNFEGAKHCLGRAITVQPGEGHKKYMSMAQLLTGKDSLHCYQKGIDILKTVVDGLHEKTTKSPKKTSNINTVTEMATDLDPSNIKVAATTRTEGCENEPEMDEEDRENVPQPSSSQAEKDSSRESLVQQISLAFCSIAELYMTDLCDEEEAEEQCQANITLAIQADPANPEAYQHMASFLLVKQDLEEAKTYINKSLAIWLPKYKEVDEGKAAAGSFDPVEVCPLSYSTRLSAARILIEVEEYKQAVEVLEGLTQENDEVVDTWYLLGWTYYLQGEEHQDAARYHLHKAMMVHGSSPCEDQQMVEHLQELTEELGPYTEDDPTSTHDTTIENELEEDSEDEEESMDLN